ncbi:MAG TPA: lmo0937 family membrane protein [Gemmatimonadales bacterium]|jgi:uncharacterized membrane protein YqjE
MFALLAIVLIVIWLVGFAAFHVTAWAIHLLLVVAVLAFIWHLITGRKSAP